MLAGRVVAPVERSAASLSMFSTSVGCGEGSCGGVVPWTGPGASLAWLSVVVLEIIPSSRSSNDATVGLATRRLSDSSRKLGGSHGGNAPS